MFEDFVKSIFVSTITVIIVLSLVKIGVIDMSSEYSYKRDKFPVISSDTIQWTKELPIKPGIYLAYTPLSDSIFYDVVILEMVGGKMMESRYGGTDFRVIDDDYRYRYWSLEPIIIPQ